MGLGLASTQQAVQADKIKLAELVPRHYSQLILPFNRTLYFKESPVRVEKSMEGWLFVLIIVFSVIAVFFVGLFAVKIYRKIKPFEEVESEGFSISVSHNIQSDGFFKTYFIGLILCSPILYYFYTML